MADGTIYGVKVTFNDGSDKTFAAIRHEKFDEGLEILGPECKTVFKSNEFADYEVTAAL